MYTALKPKRILVLDDEPVVLKLLNQHLRSCNFEAITTSSWTEAIDLITHDPPDLILLDLHMPTVQGESVLDFIREEGLNLPVIIISAHLSERKIEELETLGVEDFAPKPFSLQDLVSKILRVVQPFSLDTPTPVETPNPGPVETAFPQTAAPAPSPQNYDRTQTPPQNSGDLEPQSDHFTYHRRRRRRKHRSSRKLKIYAIVAVLCLIGSIANFFISRVPSYVSEGLQQAVDKSLEAERFHRMETLGKKRFGTETEDTDPSHR